jgi:hypothetical protein
MSGSEKRRAHLYIASQCRAAKALPLQSEKHSICESGKSAKASFPFRSSTIRFLRDSKTIKPTKGASTMAIYHLSAQVISRAAGRSAVAAAAYRAGEKLQDERLGQVHDFTRKQVADRLILAPQDAPEWVHDRQRLWNEVERVEKRKDAQLCRELNVALPRELDAKQQLQLIKDYCQEQFVERGMACDLTIHRNDPQNPHAHIMLTTRYLSPEGFGQKNREWNDKELLQSWREQWAEHANRALERAEVLERIDHRSFKEQGIEDRLPTVHEGPTVREMEKRGIRTERGELNRLAKEHNRIVVDLAAYRQEKEALHERGSAMLPEEKQLIARAEKVIGQPVTIQALKAAVDQLREKEKGLQLKEQQLQANLEPFKRGELLFREIEYCKQEMESSSAFRRVLSKEEREKYRALEKRGARAESELIVHGFKDKESFESRKAKVTAYTQQELGAIENLREKIARARQILAQTEKALQQIEVRELAAQYPEWKGARHLSYVHAKAIKAVNEQVGRTVQPHEIEGGYKQRLAQMSQLQQTIYDIKQTGSRLHSARSWVEAYEAQAKKEKKLFQSPKAKAQLRQDMEHSQRMMKHYGVESQADYNRQLSQHEQALAEKPAIELQISKLEPGLELLRRAMDAIQEADRAARRQQEQEQWRKQQKSRGHGKHHDHGYER